MNARIDGFVVRSSKVGTGAKDCNFMCLAVTPIEFRWDYWQVNMNKPGLHRWKNDVFFFGWVGTLSLILVREIFSPSLACTGFKALCTRCSTENHSQLQLLGGSERKVLLGPLNDGLPPVLKSKHTCQLHVLYGD